MDSGNAGPSRSPGGSVKRARQRVLEGQATRATFSPDSVDPLSPSSHGSPPRTSPTSRQYPYNHSQGAQRPPVPSVPALNQLSIDATDPVIQNNVGSQRTNSPTKPNGLAKGPPPQRPPRPSFVPSMVDPSQRAQFPGQPQHRRWAEEPLSPPGQDQFSERYSSGSSRPTTTSSGSSAGTIPDFPIASPQLTSPQLTSPQLTSPFIPRRSGNLGPPPSARKGGATFYSQNSYVTPIPEEQSETHSSYASSHVIPASWGDGPPHSYIDEGIDEEDEESVNSGGRHSRAGDHDEDTGLVRKVSIGKPGKPSLKNIGSGEGPPNGHKGEDTLASSDERRRLGPGAVTAAAGILAPPGADYENGRLFSQLEDTSAVPAPLRPSAPTSKGGSASTSGARTPITPVDPRIKAVLGSLEKGGALGSSGSTTPIGSVPPSMSDRNTRRPARLNLEAVRESEQARGSSSSLPELIRRATKLASNLDRGRTASRLGFLGMLEEKERANLDREGRGSRSASISDMLAAFPSPSLATPTGEKPGSRWPSPLPRSGLSRSHTAGPNSPTSYDRSRSRKCCGMPIWAFVLLCIILILLIAAAVVIPITLIVLPRRNNGASADLQACKRSNPCSHGGTSVLVANTCRCVCANGYTGSRCSTGADIACISTDITDAGHATFTNATLGTGIPRLLSAAQSNFTIPLSAQAVLSLFSSQNLSCTSENALVTFDGKSQRRRSLTSNLPVNIDFEEPLISIPPNPDTQIEPAVAPLPILLPTSTLAPPHLLNRDIQSTILPDTVSSNPATTTPTTGPANNGVATSNSIIFMATSAAAAIPSAASNPASPSSTSPSFPSSSSSKITPTILDFARVAILFIFQEEDLETAVRAQERLQEALEGVGEGKSGEGYEMSGMDAGSGRGGSIVVDFVGLRVGLGNGTFFGGRGGT